MVAHGYSRATEDRLTIWSMAVGTDGDLVLDGPEPDVRTDCGIYGAKWGHKPHLVFTEVGTS